MLPCDVKMRIRVNTSVPKVFMELRFLNPRNFTKIILLETCLISHRLTTRNYGLPHWPKLKDLTMGCLQADQRYPYQHHQKEGGTEENVINFISNVIHVQEIQTSKVMAKYVLIWEIKFNS